MNCDRARRGDALQGGRYRQLPWLFLFACSACGYIRYENEGGGAANEGIPAGVRGFRSRVSVSGDRVEAAVEQFPLFIGWQENAALASLLEGNTPQFFATLANDSRLLPSELEHYDPATGALAFWVLCPELQPGRTVALDLYVDTSGSARDSEVTELWRRAGIQGVWHLGEEAQGLEREFHDSSEAQVHGQGGAGVADYLPQRTPSLLGLGQRFDGGGDLIRFSAGQAAAESGSLSHWLYSEAESGPRIAYYESAGSGSDYNGFGTGTPQGYEWHSAINDNLTSMGLVWSERNPGINEFTNYVFGTGAPPRGRWSHVALSWNAQNIRLFIDGVLTQTVASPTTPRATFTADFRALGTCKDAAPPNNNASARARSWHGMIDELQISASTREAEWFRLAFANQADPGSFLAIGAFERVR